MKALVMNCSPVRNGATAEIVRTIAEELSKRYETGSICIDDYSFGFCKGCRSCHKKAVCVLEDDVPKLMRAFDEAEVIVLVSPSYWADIPGQFKSFIDRCTPWCNTHEPHASLAPGKRGYAVSLRTGPGLKECERIVQSIEHFFGHLEIECAGHLLLCSIEFRAQVAPRIPEILEFCEKI